MHHNIFLEITDQNSDLTIVPVEINWHFLAHLRQSFKMKYGATWELKAEHILTSFNVQNCQHVSRKFQTGYIEAEAKEEDDDFEDDDDEPVSKSLLKVSPIAGIACS